MKWTQLNHLPILKKSEFHYLIDTLEYELHLDIGKDELTLIVYEYTSNIKEIMIELFENNIEFSHHISKDVELSYLIITL